VLPVAESSKPCPNRVTAVGARFVLALVLVLGLFGSGAAYGKKKKPKALPPPPGDLPGHVNYLARQLYGVPLDESGPITSQIQSLVFGHLNEWLANRLPTDEGGLPFEVRVRREMDVAFSQLHYPLVGSPVVFAQPWKDRTLIGAGYTLGWTDYNRVNAVALYLAQAGKTRPVALTNFVPHTDLHYAFPVAPVYDSFWFIVYGNRLGKSHLRLSAILYSFDGQSLKSLWERDDVFDGKIDVRGNRAVIRYLKEDEFIQALEKHQNLTYYEAVYNVTPKGLELETDRVVP